MGTYEAEQARLQRLMDETFDEEGIDDTDEEFINEQLDVFETREEDSESEQDLSDGEDLTEEYSNKLYFLGKPSKNKPNDAIRWFKHPSNQNVRTRSCNIIFHAPGNTTVSKGKTNPLDCWSCIFSNNIIEKMVEYTNAIIETKSENYSRERDSRKTNKSEIFAVIGLLYLAAVNKSGRLNTRQLWSRNGTGIEIFRLTMGINRFHFLLNCLRFDIKNTRTERLLIDKLAPIREIFDIFNDNCIRSYSTSAYMTIDEKLEAFRGRCNFKQYIPSKPNKYGIKIFALVDAKMFYTKTLEVYVGQQPEGPYRVSNSSSDIVKRLSTSIHGSARNITIDNWFTSVQLVSDMLHNHKITVVGTLKKNRIGIPPIFVDGKIRPKYSSLCGFTKDTTLLSYIPKERKTVLLLSSMHHDDTIDSETGEKKKPELVTFYNETKGGVDVVDKMCASYNCARNTKWWPMVIFYSMLNVAGINSQIIFEGNCEEDQYMRRRLFLEKLSFQLLEEHLQQRAKNVNVPKQIRERIKEILKIEDPEPVGRENKRGSCIECSKRRLSRYSCYKCRSYLCLEHSLIVCKNCSQ